MPFLIENIARIAFAILLVLILGNGILIMAAIARRQRRERYFRRLDAMRKEFAPTVAGVLEGKIGYAVGLTTLARVSGLDRMVLLERLLLTNKPPEEQLPTLARLCEDLGLVKAWESRLTGRIDPEILREGLVTRQGLFDRVARLGYIIRAQSAENLGLIRHRASWRLLVGALDDKHQDLQTVAARALAAIQEPESFPLLVERMHRVLLDPESALSLRTIKSALIQFPISNAPHLLPSLRHSHRRIRFLATDIIREMAEREVGGDPDYVLDPKIFGGEMAETFLTLLPFDENPDVRARSAPLIGYLGDPRSTAVLLTLLQDAEWFVRLHSVRALARRKYLPQASRVAERLTDSHWMVREASARALLAYGRQGVDQLVAHFLSTDDRYSREQIADEMQRAGLIPTVLQEFASEPGSQSRELINQLAQMGKTSYIVSYLESDADHDVQKKFVEDFGGQKDPQIRAWVRRLTRQDADPILRSLALNTLGVALSRGET